MGEVPLVPRRTEGAKSYRVTMDRAGRWHVAFAVIPAPVPAPGNGQVVGIDRGVAVSAALSTGELLHCPALTARERRRLRRLQRTLARAKRGSNRRGRVRHAIARLRARETDRRKDWAEKVSTGIARRFDVIRVENLRIKNMTRSAKGTRENPGRNVRQKAGLNRGILGSGWGLLVRRLADKAPGRVEKVKPHYTSQRCSACGQVDARSRESQPRFVCTACGFAGNADVNAAVNIAAGHAVTARGGDGAAQPVNREPQLLASLAGRGQLESPALRWGRMSTTYSPSAAPSTPTRRRRCPPTGRAISPSAAGSSRSRAPPSSTTAAVIVVALAPHEGHTAALYLSGAEVVGLLWYLLYLRPRITRRSAGVYRTETIAAEKPAAARLG